MLKGIGKFGRAWKVDRFVLHYIATGDDPYDTAMTYGYVNAALSSLAPLCKKRFRVKDCSVWTDVDFTADKTFLEGGLALTINLWRIFGVVNSILFGALKILIRSKRRQKKEAKALKKARKAEAATEGPAETIENRKKQKTYRKRKGWQQMDNINPIGELMQSTMDNVKNMLKVDTVVGEPIYTPDGITLVPISRISVGFGGGGVEFSPKKAGEPALWRRQRHRREDRPHRLPGHQGGHGADDQHHPARQHHRGPHHRPGAPGDGQGGRLHQQAAGQIKRNRKRIISTTCLNRWCLLCEKP